MSRHNAWLRNASALGIALSAITGALLVPVQGASAQDSGRPVPIRQGPVRDGAASHLKAQGKPAKPRRPIVDKLQQRVDNVLRTRLQLSDEQFNKLRAMNSRLEEERLSNRQEEQATRRELRQMLLPGAAQNDARMTELLDKLPAIERKRIAMQEREQKELAGFLQPSQRARYFALQDEIRRSLQDVQRLRRVPADSAPPAMRGRGGRAGPPGHRLPPAGSSR